MFSRNGGGARYTKSNLFGVAIDLLALVLKDHSLNYVSKVLRLMAIAHSSPAWRLRIELFLDAATCGKAFLAHFPPYPRRTPVRLAPLLAFWASLSSTVSFYLGFVARNKTEGRDIGHELAHRLRIVPLASSSISSPVRYLHICLSVFLVVYRW